VNDLLSGGIGEQDRAVALGRNGGAVAVEIVRVNCIIE
jgi:hypothetical protein